MADADKTTAEADLIPIPFDEPDSIASANARGGWSKIHEPVGGTPKPQPLRGKGKGAGMRGGN